MSALLECEAVSSPYCEAPPESRERGDGVRMLRCYCCGLPSCAACSSVQPRIARGRRRARVCDNCLLQESGGEARVLLRRHHEAGYPDVTLEECIQMVGVGA